MHLECPQTIFAERQGKGTEFMGQDQQVGKSFMRNILHDRAANTLAISAAAMIPLMAMVGGGIDASRYYMAAARMQNACDAGALAARREMTTDVFTDAHKTTGLNLFDQNFNEGIFGIENRTRNYTTDGQGKVTGTASGVLPTTIMDAFGYEQFNITVTCSADVNISNTDIMFVLDVTGSMNCPDNNIANCPGGGNNNNTEVSNSLIVGLRSAVLNFYDTVETSTSASAQVRYGVVAYSNLVNVGYSLNRNWMVDNATYQSRTPDPVVTETWVSRGVTSSNRTGNRSSTTFIGNRNTVWNNVANLSACQTIANQQHWDIFVSTNPANMAPTSTTNNGNTRTATYTGNLNWKVLHTFTGGTYNSSAQTCSLNYDEYSYTANGTVTMTEERETTTTFAWTYRPVTFDVRNVYNTNREMTAPTGANGANVTHTWKGCIEEADTVSGSFNPVPANAFDHDVDLVPDTNAERWRPAMPSLVFYRYANNGGRRRANVVQTQANWGNPDDYCPKPAMKLADINRTTLDNYLKRENGFIARGATYHDYGMLWGARFIAPDGIFSSENRTAPNGDEIARHIVFMTDGRQAGSQDVYGLYGIEFWDRRVTTNGTAAEIEDRHAERFQAACRSARARNITVWVVAFGTELTPELTNCASPGRAFQASNNATLNARFQEIAQTIAALRLTS